MEVEGRTHYVELDIELASFLLHVHSLFLLLGESLDWSLILLLDLFIALDVDPLFGVLRILLGLFTCAVYSIDLFIHSLETGIIRLAKFLPHEAIQQ